MKNQKWLVIGLILVFIILINQNGKEMKKETGETVTDTSNSPVNLGGELRLTFTINSQTNVPLWKVKDIVVPSGWNYIDKEVTGASGLDHNELCSTQDDGKFGCSLFASPGSIVAKTLTLRYTAPSTASAATFSGNWETYYGDPGVLQNSQAWSKSVSTQSGCSCTSWQNNVCGGGTCASTQMQQTKTCNPPGCEEETQCVTDASCDLPPSTISVASTSNSPVSSGQEIRVTFTISSQTGVNLWKSKDIVVPSGWTYIDKEVTGASGPDHNELCSTQDDGKFGCSLFASPGSTVAKTLTLRYSGTSNGNLVGNWWVNEEGKSPNSGNFNIVVTIGTTDCTSNTDCNDDNVCTLNQCISNQCDYNTPANEGGSCLVGTTAGTCQIGTCVPTSNLCGNGEIDAGEDCDGALLGGKTCADLTGYVNGTLSCTSACKYDKSNCVADITCEERLGCEPWEQCNDKEDGCEMASWVWLVIAFMAFMIFLKMFK